MKYSVAHRLPIEIWVNVAVILRDTFPCLHCPSSIDDDPCAIGCDVKDFRSIRPLAQIFWYLHNAIQPILFEYISLTGFNTRKKESLASALVNRPKLQSAVRGLRLEFFESGHISDGFRQVLPLLTELRSLTLTSSTINPAIVQLLQNATHLRTLYLLYIEWDEDVPQDWPLSAQLGASLKALVLDDMLGIKPYHTLKSTHLLAPTLLSLEVPSSFIFEYMKSSPRLPFASSLIKLRTRVEKDHGNAVIKFISQCLNIERLVVAGVPDAVNPRLDFTFYFLKELLVPGRPIRSVKGCPRSDIFAQPLPDLDEVFVTDA